VRVRRTRTPLIGPLASWELFRLARRGQSHRGRLLVVYLLLIGFILMPILWFPRVDPIDLFLGPPDTLPTSEATEFARRFVLVLLESILLAVAAMAPGYAAAAIAEEKERGTLALLLTTALTDREIVFGKAAGRFGFVFAASTAGLPVVAAITVVGGVDVRFVMTGFALIAGTAALATAIGVHSACVTNDLRAAMVRAYGVTALIVGGAFIPPCVLISPFGVLAMIEMTKWWPVYPLIGLGYPAIQFAIAAGFLVDGARRLRPGQQSLLESRPAEKPLPLKALPDEPDEPWQKPDTWSKPRSHLILDRQPNRLAESHRTRLPPIADLDPLLWKERFVIGRAGGNDTGRVAVVGFGCLGALLLAIGGWILLDRLIDPGKVPDEGGRLVMTAGTIFAGVYLFPVAISLASAVARERRRQTLESLLALPMSRRRILWTKVRAAVERGWWWPVLAVVAAGLSFGADGGWPLGFAAAIVFFAGTVFVVGLGSWLTVRSLSEMRALRFLIPAVVIVVGLPVFVWNTMDWTVPLLPRLGMTAGAVIFAVAASLLWWRAGREMGL
jgi:ABC-type transport system involved in multi-copper enzyme maturation permease subunit